MDSCSDKVARTVNRRGRIVVGNDTAGAPRRGTRAKPPAAAPKPKKAPRPRVKNDPRLVAAARELRDRWLEHVNADPSALLTEAKYDVGRRIERRAVERERRLLAG
jgi:hypothetical protein